MIFFSFGCPVGALRLLGLPKELRIAGPKLLSSAEMPCERTCILRGEMATLAVSRPLTLGNGRKPQALTSFWRASVVIYAAWTGGRTAAPAADSSAREPAEVGIRQIPS